VPHRGHVAEGVGILKRATWAKPWQPVTFSAMRVLSIGDEVRPGHYRRHSCFPKAINFFNGDALVALVREEIGPGPTNLVVTQFPDDPMPPWLEIVEGGRRAMLGGLTLDLETADRYDSCLPECILQWECLHRNLPTFGAALKTKAPPESLAFLLDGSRLAAFRGGFAAGFACRAAGAADQILHGDLLAGIRSLKGCGPGLTPSGDDFHAGLLLALNIMLNHRDASANACLRATIGRVYQAAQGESLLSNVFLELASRGRVFARTKALIREICTVEAASIAAVVEAALYVGATSGADLAVGLYLGLSHAERFACP